MKTLNRNYLFFLSIVSLPLYAQDKATGLADKFFESGFYEEAILEYSRYLYFNAKEEDISYAFYKIGLAYRNINNLEKSLEAMELSAGSANNDSLREERKIDVALTYIASRSYNKAKFILIKLVSFSSIPEIRKKASLFLGITHLYCYEWESAKDALKIYFEEGGNHKLAHSIDTLLTSAEDMNYKSVRTAKWLSTFLPGTGQIYAGNVSDGINALLLNGANIYFIIYKLLNEEYGNAYVIYFFLFRRYYYGNIYRARSAAIEHNRKLNEHAADSVFNLLKMAEE